MSKRADCIDHPIVAGMIDVLWAGAHLDAHGGLRDLHDLLGAIDVLRPGAVAPRVAIAWWHVRARAWDDALAELTRTERDGEFPSLGSALMALCLYARGDPAWRPYAHAAVRAADDRTAVRTAQALLDAPEIAPRTARERSGEPRLRLVRGAG